MGMSAYFARLRARVGHDLVLVPGVVAVVHDARGRVLLQRRSDTMRWNLPGGAVEPGESPAEAVRREVLEETGVEVTPVAIVAVLGGAPGFRARYPNGDQIEWMTVAFRCRPRSAKLVDFGDETAEVRWCPKDQFPDLGHPFPREMFDLQRTSAWFDAS